MIKPFLILQLRPEDEAADSELAAFLEHGNIPPESFRRIRMDKQSIPEVNLDEYSAVIVGGGPSCLSDDESKKSPEQKRFESELKPLLDKIIALDFPYLGACYGLSILAQHIGGEVSKRRYAETVEATVISLTEAAKDDPLTKGLPTTFKAFGGHKESCQDVPPGAVLLASSKKCPIHMIRYKQNIYATQFHTELDKAGLALRIRTYRDLGYFPAEDADKLIQASENEEVTTPETILQRFVERYSKSN